MTTRRKRGVHGVLMAALAIGLMITASGAPVRADESSRRRLRDEIERLLADMASELRDVPGDSSTSDLDRTVDYAGRVAEKARDLKNDAGDDSDARRMGESYPDIASRYKDAAGYLRELKKGHRKVDEWPKKCEDATRELVARMRAFTDSPDPRGVDEVPRLAREFGRVGKEASEQAERTKNEMYGWLDRVDDFSYSDGRWSDVRNNLVAAGQAMYQHTLKQWEQVKRDDVCGNLAKEERNPLVEEAMKKLFEGKKGIEMVYEGLDRELGELASYLDRLEGDSGDADVASAEGKLAAVERLLEQLDRVKGSDGEARRRVETWRNLARAARAALPHLRTLKQAQYLADKAPEKCQETRQRLDEIIRGFVDKRDTRGIAQIPLRARGFAEPIKAGLARTDEQHGVMERAFAEAQRFDASEGRWRDVRDRYRASAAAIFEHWKKARAAAHEQCDKLAMGAENPDVKAKVTLLENSKTSNTRDLDVLRADQRTWYAGIQELRRWYKQDTAAVRDMFCKLPESPGDSAEGDAYAAKLAELANRMRDNVRPRWQSIQRDGDALVARADRLMKEEDEELAKGAQRSAKDITGVMASLQRLLDNELGGANDPEFRAKMETGKNEHKRIQSDSSKCTASELTFGSRRVDCIRVSGSTCYVVEIKPNNSGAQARGKEQIEDGIEEIEKALRGVKKRDELKDKLEVFRSCFDEASQTAKLEPELRVYEYCPPEGELFKDFVVELPQ